jgi:AcrR family transcriptional regulator
MGRTVNTPPVAKRLSTSQALMEAAEHLFGLHGIEGVSLRQINMAARLGNKSAIHYHFADRAELLAAIWRYRLPQLNNRRLVLLRQSRERGSTSDPLVLLAIFAQPIYEIVDAEGHHCFAAYARFALRASESKALPDIVYAEDPSLAMALDELTKVGRRREPRFSRDVAWYRVRYAMSVFFDMVFERDHSSAPPLGMARSEDEFFADGVAMMAAMCLR